MLVEARPVPDTHRSYDELIFTIVVVTITWAGNEYAGLGTKSPWFQPTSFGVPLHFVLFFLLLVLLSPYVITSPRFDLTARMRSDHLLAIAGFGWAVIGFAIAAAILRGAPELFADWRNLLIVVITAIFASRFLGCRAWKARVLSDLATAYGLLAIPLLTRYAAGAGDTVFGVRTTVFDGTSLYLGAFAAVTALWYYLHPLPMLDRFRSLLLNVAGIAGSLLVVLSFRRSFWLAWIVALMVALIVALRSRGTQGSRVYISLLGLGVLLILGTVALGAETVVARLESFLPNSSGEFTATNRDHVNDIIDAWQVIRDEPVLGLGIGTTYETNLIAEWKTESFEVHNAFVHVWLKFGVLGMLAYAAFHVGLIRSSLKSRDLIPIAAFLVGQIVANMFGTWPYGSFQMSVFHGVLIAVLFVNLPAMRPRQRARPALTVRRP